MADSNSFKILIVDDEDSIRETYAQIFKQRGIEVLTANDGVEGLDIASKELPDVIMTGIIMPRMDGFQLIKTLEENVQTKDIPIMILSHLGREEDRKKAQKMGVEAFIVQGSITPNEIVDRAKSLTRIGGSLKISFDPYACDAPRLAKILPNENFNCPNCQEKIVIELAPGTPDSKFEAKFVCPKCNFSYPQ